MLLDRHDGSAIDERKDFLYFIPHCILMLKCAMHLLHMRQKVFHVSILHRAASNQCIQRSQQRILLFGSCRPSLTSCSRAALIAPLQTIMLKLSEIPLANSPTVTAFFISAYLRAFSHLNNKKPPKVKLLLGGILLFSASSQPVSPLPSPTGCLCRSYRALHQTGLPHQAQYQSHEYCFRLV